MSDQLRALQVDVDLRLYRLWGAAMESPLAGRLDDAGLLEVFGDCLRAAYATGYRDALREDAEGRRGELVRSNGYTTKEER